MRGGGAADRLSTHMFLVGVLDGQGAQEQDQQGDTEWQSFNSWVASGANPHNKAARLVGGTASAPGHGGRLGLHRITYTCGDGHGAQISEHVWRGQREAFGGGG